MPDTAALKIFNISIDFIQAAKEECNINIGDTKESNTRQEVHVVEKSCTNMVADSEVSSNINGHSDNNNENTIANSFPSSPNVEAD